MNKTTAIGTVLAATTDQPVVFTTGYACRIAKHLADRPGHFYMTGSMGLAASIATGIALATGRTAVAVDGDGSLLMNPTTLVTAGALHELPLVHLVLDDASYASTGGQRTPAAATDFTAWARACGYPSVARTDRPDELAALLREALERPAQTLIQCVLTDPDDGVPPRIDLDLAEHHRAFTRHVSALT
ncbi:thiamine pyrophosphate-dependent enzyme [Kitasatospora sp. NPDC004669]|uniref:thiamine pyrophosphate-dependent enzyme n=1 Tax=Kitasatospora sp. NPDC004669 TaxID=3154555 RepID=UPI0033BF0F86